MTLTEPCSCCAAKPKLAVCPPFKEPEIVSCTIFKHPDPVECKISEPIEKKEEANNEEISENDLKNIEFFFGCFDTDKNGRISEEGKFSILFYSYLM